MTYGLTPAGFVKKPLDVIKSEEETGLQATFGEINTDPESVFGQLIGTTAKEVADLWETAEAVYFSQYPNSAEGKSLNDVALLIGIQRLPATATRVSAVISGIEGTVVPQGSLATQPDSNYTFALTEDTIISRTSAVYIEVTIDPFVIGDFYRVFMNGVHRTREAITTSDALVHDFVNYIGTNHNATFYATYINSTTFSITASDPERPINFSGTPNLKFSNMLTPATFVATQTGAIAVPIGTLTRTVTSIAGWQSVNNLVAGVTGRDVETDAELRLRRAQAFVVGGYATVEAIRSHLLQEVPEVRNVTIIENRTMKQSPLTFTIASSFIAGDKVNVVIDGIFLGQINTIAGNQQASMNLIGNLILTSPVVASIQVSAFPFREITVNFKSGVQATFNDLIILRGLNTIPFTKSGGRPPKSFEVIVEGGDDADIANNIWKTKPAGIETFGKNQYNVTDSMGNLQAIFFTKAQPLYIWVKVTATVNPEETLAGGNKIDAAEIIKDNILVYGNSLKMGQDVILQRVLCKVIDVSGIGTANVTMAFSTNIDTPPAPGDYVGANITVGDTQIATFNLDNISVTIL